MNHPNSSGHFTLELMHKFKLSCNFVTFSEGQGHSNPYHNVEFACVYHRTKFKRNCFISVQTPAKRLCDASSVLVGVVLPISSRFQPSPLASKLLVASRKGEHCASVSPCKYIAYPQQVLCSAFSRRQVLLGTVRPQH